VETTISSVSGQVRAGALPAAVIKRDGTLAAFDAAKIASALARAGAATGEFDGEAAARLAAQAVKVIAHRFAGATPTIENIQDVAEHVLIAADHVATARAYIVYREQHKRLRADRRTVVDVAASMNEYLTPTPTRAIRWAG